MLVNFENVSLMEELGIKIMDPLEALDLVGLADKKNNFPSQMSGGRSRGYRSQERSQRNHGFFYVMNLRAHSIQTPEEKF